MIASASRRDAAGIGQHGAALYPLLLAPVAPVIAGSSRLLIVPDPLFQDLPFGLVRDPRGRPQTRVAPCSTRPSATVYTSRSARRRPRLGADIACRPSPVRRAASLSGHGCPARSPRPKRWPRRGATAAAPFRELDSLRQRLTVADAFDFAVRRSSVMGRSGSIVDDVEPSRLKLGAADIGGETTSRGCASYRGRVVRTIDLRRAAGPAMRRPGSSGRRSRGVPTVVGSVLPLDDRRAGDVFAAFFRRLAGGEDPPRAVRDACLQAYFDRAPASGPPLRSLAFRYSYRIGPVPILLRHPYLPP